MGSLRNPVGPLPSSIYWRRRAVLVSMVAVLALLITWVVTSDGGGGGKNGADGSNDKNPTASITPGPSGSEPAISEAPGGRDESGDGGDGGSGDSGGSAGSGDADGSASGGSASGGGGVDDGKGGGGSSGDTLPAGSTLPNCAAGAVNLTVRSVNNTYAPDEKPTFELIARNSSGSDCKLDLGPKNAVLTITKAADDNEIWSSADCPTSAAAILLRIPADERVTHTVEWNRKSSAPNCATPPATSATAGTYLVEAKAPGFTKTQTSFVLKKD